MASSHEDGFQQELDRLLEVPDLGDFIAQAYRTILHREPDRQGIRRYARHLKLVPFYTRRTFLNQLLASGEYRQLLDQRDRELQRQRQELDQRERDLQRERQELDQQRSDLEALSRIRKAAEAGQARIFQERLDRSRDEQWQAVESILLAAHQDLLNIEDLETFLQESYRTILGRVPEPWSQVQTRQRLRGSVSRLKRELLRSLLVERQNQVSGSDQGSVSCRIDPARISRPRECTAPCRICGGDLVYRWSREVMACNYLADYYECVSCQALQVPHPFWLEEAYWDEHLPSLRNLDPGRFARNFSVYHWFVALHQAEVFPENPALLDFGGGYGILTQMLKSAGFEAWQLDPYVSVPFLASDRCAGDLHALPAGSFDGVFALEVLEHLTDPDPLLRLLARALKPEGILLLSTGIYRPGVHDRHWHYLATEGGQHVTFWSEKALACCAQRIGFRSMGYFPGGDGFCILWSRLEEGPLRERLARALASLKSGEHLGPAVRPWELITGGHVKMLDEAVVHGLAPGPSPR
jgi:SAM-dependent methyltransferase